MTAPSAAPDITTVLAAIKPKRKVVRLCLDGDLLAQLEAVERELLHAKVKDSGENRTPQAPRIAREYEDLREQVVAAEVEFVFVAIGRRAWSDLMLAHPPTKQEQEEAKQQGMVAQFNAETFPIAAVAASCKQPAGMTVEAVEQLYAQLNDGQWLRLWTEGCLGANITGTDVPFSAAAYAELHVSETSTGRRETTESPAASS